MPRQSIADQVNQAQRMLDVVDTDPALRALLDSRGFSAEVFADGRQRLAAVLAARAETHGNHGDQLQSTDTVEQLHAQVLRNIGGLSTVARTLFKDAATRERLGLRRSQRASLDLANPAPTPDGEETESAPARRRRLSTSQAAVIDRGTLLYEGVLSSPELVAALATSGYGQARLEEERALVQQLATIDARQESAKGDAKAAVDRQAAALDALNTWVSRVKAGVRASFRGRRDVLDKLGL